MSATRIIQNVRHAKAKANALGHKVGRFSHEQETISRKVAIGQCSRGRCLAMAVAYRTGIEGHAVRGVCSAIIGRVDDPRLALS